MVPAEAPSLSSIVPIVESNIRIERRPPCPGRESLTGGLPGYALRVASVEDDFSVADGPQPWSADFNVSTRWGRGKANPDFIGSSGHFQPDMRISLVPEGAD